MSRVPWQNFDPTPYDREGYRKHVNSYRKEQFSWVKYVVLHNTGMPTLAMWGEGEAEIRARLANLKHYYAEVLTPHWHQGPHGFISRTHISGFSDPTQPGVHCSCSNSESLGLEMVGDYSTEPFDHGDGALVRDNAAFALALWHLKVGLDPRNWAFKQHGLHFHHDCLKDHHACPGRNVDRADMQKRVVALMETLSDKPPNVDTPTKKSAAEAPHAKTPEDEKADVELLQRSLNTVGATPPLKVDGDVGPKTEKAIRDYQGAAGLIVSGKYDATTRTYLERDVAQRAKRVKPTPVQAQSRSDMQQETR